MSINLCNISLLLYALSYISMTKKSVVCHEYGELSPWVFKPFDKRLFCCDVVQFLFMLNTVSISNISLM